MPEPTTGPRPAPRLTWWKKALFAASAFVLFFAVLECALWLAGVKPVLYAEDPYLGFAGSSPLFVKNPGGSEMETAQNKLRWFNAQHFAARKPSGTRRVFCLGGSTTYGHPYEDPLSFCGMLRELLPAADPAHRYEVVNAGGISYASYRVARLMEELAQYEPDLFVVYSGHNEFLERRTYGERIDAPPALHDSLLARSRVYTAVRGLLRPSVAAPKKGEAVLDEEVKAILDASVGPKDYSRDDGWQAGVLSHYRFNLERMAAIARSAGAEILFVVPAANLKDCAPFKSEHTAGLKPEDARRAEALVAEGTSKLAANEPQAALAALEQALALDHRHAEAQYRAGQALYALERFGKAKAAFQRALNEDICPLRAFDSMQQAVRSAAAAQNAVLYDFAAAAEQASPHGIPDAGLFLDHVHCDVEGYWMLALGVLDALAGRKWLAPAANWNAQAAGAVKKEVLARLDAKAQGVALKNLAKTLSWAGKVEEAGRLAMRAENLLSGDSESAAIHAAGAAAKGDWDAAIAQYEKALAADPSDVKTRFNLGVALQKSGDKERAVEEYDKVLEADPKFADAAMNLGVLCHQDGDLRMAITFYRKALAAKPEYAEAHANLGQALLESGNTREAFVSFNEALRIDPKCVGALSGSADAHALSGTFAEAAGLYRQVLALSPDDESAACGLAASLAESGKIDDGIAALVAFIKAHPKAPQAKQLFVALSKAKAEARR
ncbi:MAG: tetratricopeptide repeat protein [Planctomycetes bacterium]|nr:tetratricopeptide repeat protein [Planctomycetota bacterium]